MKILHTSDWHLGRILHGQSLLEDQKYMLDQVCEELKRGYDVLFVAGDIFDRAVPPAKAMTFLNNFLDQVRKLKIPVVMIPGNHDNMERLNYGSSLFERHDIHIRCGYDQFEPVTVTDSTGNELDIFSMPFVEHAHVAELLDDSEVKDKESAVKALLERMRPFRREDVPSILVAHEFIAGSEESESERVFIGGSHVVNASLFNNFTYVALGHLHKFQEAGLSHIQYCGSPLAYSFGEVNNHQGVSSVTLTEQGVKVEKVSIVPKRPMVVLEDTFDELIDDAQYDRYTGHYVSARITDEGHHINLQARLRERFPYLLETRLMAVEKRLEAGAEIAGSGTDDPSELFSTFLDSFKWDNDEDRKEAIALFEQASAAAYNEEVAQ